LAEENYVLFVNTRFPFNFIIIYKWKCKRISRKVSSYTRSCQSTSEFIRRKIYNNISSKFPTNIYDPEQWKIL